MTLAHEIQTQGHWQIIVRPTKFIPDRIPYNELESTLTRAKVSLRGWDFPHIGESNELRRRLSSVGFETDWNYYREISQFYQSGQFAYLLAIHEDWADRAGERWRPPAYFAQRGPLLGVGDTLSRFTEVFAFASKLALTPAGDDEMFIKVELRRLTNRMLWVDSPNRSSFDNEYRTDLEIYPMTRVVPRGELVADYKRIAVEETANLFKRFGWDASLPLLSEQQNELRW
jgi:hypothetical protein